MKNFVLSIFALILFVGLSAQDDQKIIVIKKDKGGKWTKEEVKSTEISDWSTEFARTEHFYEEDGDEGQRLIAKKGYKAFLGVVAGHSNTGFRVSSIVSGSGAEAGGLERGDKVIDIDGKPTNGEHGLRGVLAQFEPGDQVRLNILRDGQAQTLNVTLGRREITKWVLNDERDPCDVFIGVYTTTGDTDGDGVRITSIIGNTPAEVSKLMAGDVILELNDTPINSSNKLRIERDKNNPGDDFTLLIKRNEQVINVNATFKTCEVEAEMEQLQERDAIEVEELAEDIELEIQELEKAMPYMDQPAPAALEEPTENEPLFNTPQLGLELFEYEAFPNPSVGEINIRFKAEPTATTVRLADINGKIIYEEQLNNFDGIYQKKLNLGTVPGTVLLAIQQGEKIVTKKLVLLDRN